MKLYCFIRASVLALTLIQFILPAAFAENCSLSRSQNPPCFHSRQNATYNIALVFYGREFDQDDLNRIAPILEKRFYNATDGLIDLRILIRSVIDFRFELPANYTYNNIQDSRRLHRIWYKENIGWDLFPQIYEDFLDVAPSAIVEQLDAIAVISEAQFEYLGFAQGQVAVTEYPREIAWALESGGRVDYPSDFQIVDELIHELGHTLFLGHTSVQCNKPAMDHQERKKCCKKSPGQNDVMSYCRQRKAVNENFQHRFEKCNLEMIERLIVPALLSGGASNPTGRVTCR